jgi:hypothetical protein
VGISLNNGQYAKYESLHSIFIPYRRFMFLTKHSTMQLSTPTAAQIPGICEAFHHCPGLPSPLSALQHLPTSWVCRQNNENPEAVGYLLTSLSPVMYSTAVIEFAGTRGEGGLEVLSELLREARAYWTAQCVRQLVVGHCPALPEAWWTSLGFGKDEWGGLDIFRCRLQSMSICMKNKKLLPRMNTSNGQVNEQTLFEYHQEGNTVWGLYGGGPVDKGVLLGTMDSNRDIRFHYMQLDKQGTLSTGHSVSATEFLNDGRIALYEDWTWTGDKQGSGNSILEEMAISPFPKFQKA